ncbi:MAG: phosphoribosyl-ATP diphosphatase [archaeon]
MLIIFILPKNKGLQKCKDEAIKLKEENNSSAELIEVRGEDVPYFVDSLIKEGKKAIGITGEDLFKEFQLRTPNQKIDILKIIKWEDSTCIFNKPTLCLLGSKDKEINNLNKQLKICINSKYKEIAKKKCTNYLENQGYKIERIYASGATEEFFSRGIVDLVIDIVCSGSSAEKYNLKVYDKIFSSDIVIIGRKEENKSEKEDKRIQSIYELYKKIKEKVNSDEKQSYTKKISSNENYLKRKIIEESAELITSSTKEELISESADLLYFILIFLAKNNITLRDIEKENSRRDKK